MKMQQRLLAAIAVGLTATLGFSALAGTRATVSCSFSGSKMVVTFSATETGGGKPRSVSEAGPVVIIVDQGSGRSYSKVVGMSSNLGTVTLPASAEFDMCVSGMSVVSGDSRAIRGRGAAYVSGVGLISDSCSPMKPPAC